MRNSPRTAILLAAQAPLVWLPLKALKLAVGVRAVVLLVSAAIPRMNRYSLLLRPPTVMLPGSAPSLARSWGVPATEIVAPAATLNSQAEIALAVTLLERFAVMVPPEGIVLVSFEYQTETVAPEAAPP